MSHYTMKTLAPLETGEAEPPADAIIKKTQAAFGFVPNMYNTMANLPALLATYAQGYEQFRETAGFTPAEQEAVFLTISRENGCEYCVGAHSFLADNMSKLDPAATDAIREGRDLPDDKLNALSRFTRTMVTERGWPAPEDVRAFLDAGYTEKHVLGIILAISVKTISNYSNHLFETELDPVFEDRRWSKD